MSGGIPEGISLEDHGSPEGIPEGAPRGALHNREVRNRKLIYQDPIIINTFT